MEKIPGPGEIYQHFKGNLYRIVTIAEHSESGEQLVIYQALYGDFQVYARPLPMFMEKVDAGKYPQFQGMDRFTLVPVPAVIQPDTTAAETKAEICTEETYEEADCECEPVQEKEEEPDPMLLAFLDADGYERKLEIFDSMHGRIDQSVLNTIAVSLDLELADADLEEQFMTLRNCMLTLQRYESRRLR